MSSNIVSTINHNQVTSIVSLPGMGLDTVVKMAIEEIEREQGKTVCIYPHESVIENFSQLESMVLTKLKWKDYIDEHDNNFRKIKSFVIVLNKLNHFRNSDVLLDYVDSLQRYSETKIIVVITSDAGSLHHFRNHRLLLKGALIVFPGFIDEAPKMIRQMAKQFDVKVSEEEIAEIGTLVLGHLGLIKSILMYKKEHGKIGSVMNLLEDPQTYSRLANTFDSLTEGTELHKYGLVKENQVGRLFEAYMKKQTDGDFDKLELTPMEMKIYRILECKPGEYFSVDDIIGSLVLANHFEEITDWAVYKHVSNLKKKLAVQNIVISSHRSKGYSLNRR